MIPAEYNQLWCWMQDIGSELSNFPQVAALRSRRWLLTLLVAALAVASCGGTADVAPTTAATPAQSQPNTQPPATVTPAVTDSASTEVIVTAPPLVATETAAEEPALFEGIPTGYTVEGFPYLGSPDAPVTLVDYSDFL
jgi:hypothetical protein